MTHRLNRHHAKDIFCWFRNRMGALQPLQKTTFLYTILHTIQWK